LSTLSPDCVWTKFGVAVVNRCATVWGRKVSQFLNGGVTSSSHNLRPGEPGLNNCNLINYTSGAGIIPSP